MTGELLISLDEAGRRLSLSRRSVQGLIYCGELRSLKIGRSRRIAVVELVGYVERLRRGEAEALAVVGVGAA
jgi:excisionase family DNA binding protein